MTNKELIKKFFRGHCTSSELVELHQLLQEDNSNILKDEFRQIWEEMKVYPVLDDKTSNAILENILMEIKLTSAKPKYVWTKYAASLLILLVASFAIWIALFHTQKQQISTNYGEVRKVLLPDGSLVYLNSNSTLKYFKDFIDDDIREVWLQGEGFFKVNEIQAFAPEDKAIQQKKFIVHVGKLDVEVIGTQFNIKNRRNTTEIVLDEGQVQLKQLNDNKNYVMNPGDKATLDEKNSIRIEQLNDPSLYSSWKQNEMYFDDTMLQDISEDFADNFGIELIIADQELKAKKFTGFCPADNPEILIKTLQKSFGLELIKKDNQYILKK